MVSHRDMPPPPKSAPPRPRTAASYPLPSGPAAGHRPSRNKANDRQDEARRGRSSDRPRAFASSQPSSSSFSRYSTASGTGRAPPPRRSRSPLTKRYPSPGESSYRGPRTTETFDRHRASTHHHRPPSRPPPPPSSGRYTPPASAEASSKRAPSTSSRPSASLPAPVPITAKPSSQSGSVRERLPARTRVSALKRLGPKLSISDRLGSKNKKQTADDASPSPTSKEIRERSVGEAKEADSTDPNEVEGKSDDNADSRDHENAGKSMIKLECPHCKTNCVTFGEYASHLHREAHGRAMQQLKQHLQLTLGRMRTKQKTQQEERDSQLKLREADSEKNGATSFCKVCKLDFYQKRVDHIKTEMHKLISQFLNPTCNVCKTQFFSPMAYENHIASLPHLKAKAHFGGEEDEDLQKTVEEMQDGREEEEELDLENFMTLDEVGDVEEETTEKPKDTNTEPSQASSSQSDDEAKEILDNPSQPVGEEYIQRVEMFYCALCHKYLPRTEPKEADGLLKAHCASTAHRLAFVAKRKQEKGHQEVTAANQEASESVPVNPPGNAQHFNDDQLDYEAESTNGDVKSS